MLRRLQLRVSARGWTGDRGALRRLQAAQGWIAVDTWLVFLNTALLTRPPRTKGISLADYWAWLRYSPAIASVPELRLRHEVADLDPHQKTILSDDWGMGFTASVIGLILDVRKWTDTHHFVDLAGPKRARLAKPDAKLGPCKSPDFVGVTSGRRRVVLECKGTQSDRDYSAEQVADGVKQKVALELRTPPLVSLVAGLFVPPFSHEEEPLVLVADPPDTTTDETLEPLEGDELTSLVARSSLASALRLVNMASVADDLASPNVTRLSDAAQRELESPAELGNAGYFGSEETMPLPKDMIPLGNGFATKMHFRVLIRQSIRESLLAAASIADASLKVGRGALERGPTCSHGAPLVFGQDAIQSRADDDAYAWSEKTTFAENSLGVRLEVAWR